MKKKMSVVLLAVVVVVFAFVVPVMAAGGGLPQRRLWRMPLRGDRHIAGSTCWKVPQRFAVEQCSKHLLGGVFVDCGEGYVSGGYTLCLETHKRGGERGGEWYLEEWMYQYNLPSGYLPTFLK